MNRIAIIGAGECGVRAAMQLRKLGHTDPILLLGEEPDLPYERPPLSKDEAAAPTLFAADAYADANISLHRGTAVTAIDSRARQLRLQDDSRVEYDTLLIATGARARLFPQMQDCLTLRTRADAQGIAPRLRPGATIGIIGGGFIGLEMAAKARTANAKVTVIEAASQLMARAIPADIAAHIQRAHACAGIDIRTDTMVKAADANSITLANGEQMHFDAVIAGIGAAPNVELAADAGLAVDNGIVVDGCFRTSSDGIFAAGDCCNFPWRGQQVRLESWRVAQQQGQHVAAAMLGSTAAYDKVPWSWSDQFDLSIQVAGLYAAARPVIRRDINAEAFILYQSDAAGQLCFAAGVAPGNGIARDIKIAEKLIARGVCIDADRLADNTVNLKRLLKAA